MIYPIAPFFSSRQATLSDLPELQALMEISIRQLISVFLESPKVEASFELMGVDTNLITDGTYFVIRLLSNPTARTKYGVMFNDGCSPSSCTRVHSGYCAPCALSLTRSLRFGKKSIEQDEKIIGCGGWSRRATLFGGNHTKGRDARLLDPATEPARVRAMYTHPDHARKGIGRFMLMLCEEAAQKEGFNSLELMSTIAGEPLYVAYGFQVIERVEVPTSTGLTIPLTRMTKLISKN